MCGLKKDRFCCPRRKNLLAACVFCNSFGSFRHGVLGQFSWKQKTNSSLDLTRRNGGLLVLESQSGSFRSDTFEDIVDERVHDAHGFRRNTDIGVNLLQNIVDVSGVALSSLSLTFLFASSSNLSTFLSGSLLSFLGHFWGLFSSFWCVRHDDAMNMSLLSLFRYTKNKLICSRPEKKQFNKKKGYKTIRFGRYAL